MKSIYIKDLIKNEMTNLLCWMSNKRQIKNKLFLDIYDSTGEIQGYAEKSTCEDYDNLTKVPCESALCLTGYLNEKGDFFVTKYTIAALANLQLFPTPNSNTFDALSPKVAHQVLSHPTFYVRNKKLSAIYYIKSVFKRELQDYFWKQGFVEFETPTLTRQTLYDDNGAFWLNIENQNISLSRCATFHLEPAIIAYEKVFTITNSHANEKSKTNRHLVEYLHLKAEMCWVDLEELISFAAKMYYEVALNTYKNCKEYFNLIVDKKTVEYKLEKLNPVNHVTITYDEAIGILQKNDIQLEYGKSLTAKMEHFLTKHFDENFIWIKYIPYTVEGFMFCRKEDNNFLTKTCDLIAPNGFGEILGCAEKMSDYNELTNSMKQKNKWKDYERYQDYILLRKYGLPPHGGIGMGIERALRYLLDLEHVKYIKPFAVIKHNQINH